MEKPFYDPLIHKAGQIAEEYNISISGVLGLLLQAGKDEALVRQALNASLNTEEAQEMHGLDRAFDVVEAARLRLPTLLKENAKAEETTP